MLRVRTVTIGASIVALFMATGMIVGAQGRSPQATATESATVPPGLRERIAKQGRARVLVELRLPGGAARPEGKMNATAILAQRQNIAAARTRVLARLATVRETRRYQTVPFVALDVSLTDLALLQSSNNVVRIMPDSVYRPTLWESVPHIEGDQAWQAGYDGAGTTIAIVDSGVDSTHPFIAGKVVEEGCFSSTQPGLSQSVCPNGQAVQIGPGAAIPCSLDDCLHGTHVAGIAAGNGYLAGEDFSGVARGANLAAVQVFSEIIDPVICGGEAPCLGGFESDIIAALEYLYSLKVAGRNLAAVNMSLGGGAFDAPCDAELLKPAIDNLRTIGVPTVVASGNAAEVTFITSPACISSAVSVGATTNTDEVAWFSNVAPFLSLLAPGDNITSSIPSGDYAAFSGTSMAAPHVAGAWAVLHQAVPSASVDEVLGALRTTGVPVTDLRVWAPGTTTVPRIRVFSALTSLKSISNPVPTLTSVAPGTAREGLAVQLTLAGTGFNSKSVVRWNGADVPTVAESVTELRAEVPASMVAIGMASVVVFNPEPGGGISPALTVEVLPPPSLTIDKTTVGPDQPITVTLANGYGNQLDWLAVSPVGSSDSTFLASTFVGDGVLNRTWTIAAPQPPGTYEFRLLLNNAYIRVATSPSFTVDPSISPVPVITSMTPSAAVAGAAPLTLTVYGSKFVPASVVTWNGSARATTFVSSVELRTNITAADLASAGSVPVTVVTPAPGGGTSAALPFSIAAAPTLTVSATSVAAGANVTVTLANGLGGSLDWIAFAPVGAAPNSYSEFTYVGSGVTSRTWTVAAPSTAGNYEFRLFRQGSFQLAATSPTVVVQPPPAPSLSVSATTVAGGQAVTVTLANGQGGQLDWLSFGTTTASDTGYAQFTYVGAGVTTRTWTVNVPNTAGSYEFRLYKNNSFVRLATSPTITVTGPPPPSPSLAVNLTTVGPGGSVTATLTNGTGGTADWLALAVVGSADTAYLQSTTVGSGVTTRTWTISMPTAPGSYEFRLFAVSGGVTTRRATSAPITVSNTAPALSVSATSVAPGGSVTVTLTGGPGGNLDWIAFADVTAANNNYLQFIYVGAGVTTRTWTVNAPTTPGAFEFRLFQNGTFTRIATSPTVTVQPPTLTVSTMTAAPGQSVTVTLTNGLGGATDWFALAPVGAPDNYYLNWTYVGGGVTTRTWTVTMPTAPGNYEFRLYRQASFVRAATSPPVRVQ